MVVSFFRKLASRAKSKRRGLQLRALWARPVVESLDQRVLPSVSAHLNRGGILKIIADSQQHTSQVEILQTPGQILVEDTSRLVNSFDAGQVQQIDFRIREDDHQHGHFDLAIPVNQQQMTLTGIAVGEFDLNFSAVSLTAAVSATLADGTPLSLAGPVNNQGNYDLTGTADVAVGGFSLPGTSFTLTNTGLTAAAALSVGGTNINVSGTVDNQGNYDLTGSANVTVAGFPVAALFELTNSGLSVMGDATLTLDQGTVQVHFLGSVNPNGQFLLVSTATTTNFDGFISGNAVFTLNNGGMTVVGDVTVALDPGTVQVHFLGSVYTNHQFLLVSTATTTNFDGFISGDAVFILNNSGMTVRGDVTLTLDQGTVQVHFMGSVCTNGQFQLVSTATTTNFDGYLSADATFTLSNSGLSVAGTLDVTLSGVAAHVQYMGSVDANGQFALTGTLTAGSTADFSGFLSADATFSFRNSGATITGGHIYVVMGSVGLTVNFTATLNPNGSYVVTGTAQTDPVLDGFLVGNASFHIDNDNGLTFSGQVDLNRYFPGFPLVTFSGWVHTDHHYLIMGQGPTFNLLNFVTSGSQFTLSDSGDTFSLNLLNVLNTYTVSLRGSFQSNTQFSITGSRSISIGGFPVADASFTVARSGGVYSLTVSSYINVFVASINFTGTIQSNGQYSLSGHGPANFAGFLGGSISFTLTNSGLVASGSVDVKVATIIVTATISSSGAFQYSLNTHMSFHGFGASGTITLSNSGLYVSASLDVTVLGVHMSFHGFLNTIGTYSFTFITNFSFGPVGVNLNLMLTDTGFSAHVHAALDLSTTVSYIFGSLRIGFRGSLDVGFGINSNGSYSASGRFNMTAYAGINVTVGIGFQLNNHQFCINTSELGFSIWGIGFHPFGDYCLSY